MKNTPVSLSLAKRTQVVAGRALLYGLLAASRATPEPLLLAQGRWLGDLAYRLSRKYRNMGVANLQHAYPDMSSEECHRLIRQVFINFGMSLMEFLLFDRIGSEQLPLYVDTSGAEHLRNAYNQGRGVILVTAHMGNWEIAARYCTQIMGYPLTVVARDADDPAATLLTNRIRERGGYSVLSKGNAILGVVRALKQQHLVALLCDQNAEDLWVPFFGRPAGVVAGPAAIALRTGAPVVPIFCRRHGRRHHFEALPAIHYTPTGDKETDIRALMTEITAVIEQAIRKDPAQWLWIHNRWRSRPPEERPA